MSKELNIKSLKKHLDPLWIESIDVYEKISPFLTIHKYPKGSVLRQPGAAELTARFIYCGAAALFLPSDQGREYRIRIFGQGEVASDLDSYFSGDDSPYGIKALTYLSTFEITRKNEVVILDSVPEAGLLATKITQKILINTTSWYEATSLPIMEGLKKLKDQYPESMKYLSNKDLAFIFKTSVTTVTRIFKTLP